MSATWEDTVNLAAKMLEGAGYKWQGPAWDPKTNHMSAAMSAALKAYQVDKGLPSDGTLNTDTQKSFGYSMELLSNNGVPPGTDAATIQKVKDLYGPGLASYLGHWELGPLLIQAAQQGWDQTTLNQKLQATNWWRNTQESQRAWEKLQVEDPAQAKAVLGAKADQLKRNSNQLGLQLSDNQLLSIAADSIRFAWDDQKTQSIMAGYFKGTTGKGPDGTLQLSAQQAQQMAAQYLVPLSDAQAQSYATRAAQGQLSMQALSVTFEKQAEARFPWMKDLLDQGVKPADYFGQHRNVIAQTLEMDPNQIDLIHDPRWAKVTEVVDASGKRRSMTVGEAAAFARQDPMYRQTQQGQQSANDVVAAIAQTFGAAKF